MLYHQYLHFRAIALFSSLSVNLFRSTKLIICQQKNQTYHLQLALWNLCFPLENKLCETSLATFVDSSFHGIRRFSYNVPS